MQHSAAILSVRCLTLSPSSGLSKVQLWQLLLLPLKPSLLPSDELQLLWVLLGRS
jgi:hypothetical protein